MKGTKAIPLAFVHIEITVPLLLKTPEAPEDGAVKVMLAESTGLLAVSLTITASGCGKGEPALVVCGVAPATAMDRIMPFVTEKDVVAVIGVVHTPEKLA